MAISSPFKQNLGDYPLKAQYHKKMSLFLSNTVKNCCQGTCFNSRFVNLRASMPQTLAANVCLLRRSKKKHFFYSCIFLVISCPVPPATSPEVATKLPRRGRKINLNWPNPLKSPTFSGAIFKNNCCQLKKLLRYWYPFHFQLFTLWLSIRVTFEVDFGRC